uniref:USP domain-containing protein n=1 Tax=Anguilla anguilla TaxID=7936 RepID=A0A0E9WAB7_ANGAN
MKNWKSKSGTQVYAGLRNQGSTCYLNTVLQILFMTDECRQAVMRLKVTVSKQLKKLFEDLERNVQASETRDIIHSLGINNVCRQERASECFSENIK